MPDANLKKLYYKTYLSVIEGSIGSQMFRHFYVQRVNEDADLDIMQDGEYSGAFYVSSILALMGYIKKPHSTVDSTIKDMEESGWSQTDTPKQGDITIFKKHPEFNSDNLGFYWNNDAIYNHYIDRTPVKNPLDSSRPVASYWTRNFDTVIEK